MTISIPGNVLNGTTGDDSILGGLGNDTISGGLGNDTLAGDAGDDILDGNAGNDSLLGGSGDDTLAGFQGNDTLDGGANGQFGDIANYGSDPAGVTVNLSTGTATDGWGNTDQLVNIEHAIGSASADSLIGNGNANWFEPGDGDDTVDGQGGSLDAVLYLNAASSVTVDLKAGTASGAAIGADTLISIEAAQGSKYNDSITLSDVFGYAFGRAGNDTLQGGIGSDTLFGGSGNDTIDGGAGFDIVNYSDDGYDMGPAATGNGVNVDLGGGIAIDNWGNTDTLLNIEGVVGSSLNDTLGGDSQGNRLDGQAGDDVFDGGAGNDTIIGGGGSDYLVGGQGNDFIDGGTNTYGDWVGYDYGPAGATVNLTTGIATDNWGDTDTLVGIENITGSNFNDNLTGNGNDNWFAPAEGNDAVDGKGGTDTVSYRNATGAVTVNLKTGTASGGGIGNDTLTSIEAAEGSQYGDTITLSDSSGYALGRAGNDTITGGGSDDDLYGGSGNDVLDGGAGRDTADYADESFDMGPALTGNGVTVNLETGTATDNWGNNDTLINIENVTGSAHNDSLAGDAGINWFRPGDGNDTVDGRDGQDVVMYEEAASGVAIDLKAGTATGAAIGNDTLISIEAAHGSAYDDKITLSDSSGYAFGRAGNDTLTGGAGDDVLFGGSGNDTLDGGAGHDMVDYSEEMYDMGPATTGNGVKVDLAAGTATDNWGNTDTLINIEAVVGSTHNDTLIGDDGRNFLYGDAGNDSLVGGAGDDNLLGQQGSDTLDGGANEQYGGDRVDYSEGPGGVLVDLSAGFARDNWGDTDKLIGIEHITASPFIDLLIGDGNNNWFSPDAGNDTVDGRGGHDTVMYEESTSSVTIDLNVGTASGAAIGTDTLISIEAAHGSKFDDKIILSNVSGYAFGRAGNDTIVGGTGDDNFFGGSGNDTLAGGPGFDTADYSSEDYDMGPAPTGKGVNVNLQTGTATDNWGNTDTLIDIDAARGSQHDDTLIGTTGGNFLDGNSGDDSIQGGGGDDHLIGMEGNDTLDGGADGAYGDQVDYSQGPAGVTVNLATGTATDNWGNTDTLIDIEHVIGSSHADKLTGNEKFNWFKPGDGDDTVDGQGNGDLVSYEDAASGATIDLKAGTASGAAIGNDTLISIEAAVGSKYDDKITLADNSSWTFGRGGNDTLIGGTGNDNFLGGSGNDVIDGGAGTFDVADYNDDGGDTNPALMGRGVSVNLATGFATDNWGNTDTLINIEAVHGSMGNDTLIGDTNANGLDGSAGDDMLMGGSGRDTLVGGAGNDTLDGGAITDRLNYTDQNSASYATSSGAVNVNLQTGTAQDGLGGTDKLANINYVVGSANNDTLIGSTALLLEMFEGGAGNDTIDGGAITDLVNQDNSNRVMYQNAGAAVNVDLSLGKATGGAGDDTLLNINQVRGSKFDDTLTGSDRTDVTEQFEGAGGNDVIDGKGGFDLVRYESAGAAVSVNLSIQGISQNTGGAGSDTLSNIEGVRGSSYADVLTGGGNDTLETFMGNGGDDTIDGGTGFDRADYTLSTQGISVTLKDSGDTLVHDGVIIAGVEGIDTLRNIEGIRGTSFDDTIIGNIANNKLEGRSGNDSIAGGGGDDTILAGSGVDTVDGGDGMDTLVMSGNFAAYSRQKVNSTDTRLINGATGENVTFSNIENIQFADGTKTLVQVQAVGAATSGNDSLTGTSGNDYIDGLAGVDTMVGLAGDDTYVINVTTDVVNETATGSGGIDTILIDLAAPGSYTLPTNVENGTILSGSLAVNLTGNTLNNILKGNSGANNLLGDAGDDTIAGNGGSDTVDGGAGTDTLVVMSDSSSYQRSSTATGIKLTNAATGETLTVSNVERIQFTDGTKALAEVQSIVNGTSSPDSLTGTANSELLNGLAGNDTISGLAGSDTLNGGTGNDSLLGGDGDDFLSGDEGDDTLDGGAGLDHAKYINSSGPITANFTGTSGTVVTNEGTDTLVKIENIWGSAYNDKLSGDGNTFEGRQGNDTITGSNSMIDGAAYWSSPTGVDANLETGLASDGYGGTDTITIGTVENLHGSSFSDKLTGDSRNNWFYGNGSNDTIDGHDGIDAVWYGNSVTGVTVNLQNGSAQHAGNGVAGTDTLISIEGVVGSNFNDKLTGGNAVDYFQGGDGNDTIIGNGGADWMSGDGGNDSIDGGDGDDNIALGLGADTVNGGNGFDFVTYSDLDGLSQGITVNGSATTPLSYTVTDSGGFTDTLTSIEGIVGTKNNDIFNGSVGDDIFQGGGGNDTLNGGAGSDWADYSSAGGPVNVTLVSGTTPGNATGTAKDGLGGTDTLNSIEFVCGGNFNDMLTGSAKEGNILRGGLGNDTLDGGTSPDPDPIAGTVVDWADYDSAGGAVTVNLQTGTSSGADGNDTLINMEGIRGGAFNDVLTGDGGDNWLRGGQGNDTLDGAGGSDYADYIGAGGAVSVNLGAGTATGADGNDTLISIEKLRGSQFGDVLTGSSGNDTIRGLGGADTIDGGDGYDFINYTQAAAGVNLNFAGTVDGSGFISVSAQDGADATASVDKLKNIEGAVGSNFNDTITGNSGDNYLLGMGGNDSLVGGTGVDTVAYHFATSGVNVNLALGTASGGDGNDTLSGFENISGSAFADTIVGSADANFLEGLAGNDSLSGGAGNDTLIGGIGADIVDGGADTDTVIVLGNRADYTVTRPNATDTVLISGKSGENLTLRGIEFVQFADGTQAITKVQENIVSPGDDSITGTGAADTINGGAGNDTLWGLDGNDSLIGGTGNDSLIGGTGDDTYEVDVAADAVVEGADAGYDTVNVNFAAIGTYSLGANVEKAVVTAAPTIAVNVVGNDGDNLIIGNAAANSLAGGLGKDTLDGGAGADTLAGGAGDDVYVVSDATDVVNETAPGSDGIDRVETTLTAYTLGAGVENLRYTGSTAFSGTGNADGNSIAGGAGNDTLSGLAGNDLLVGNGGNDSISGGAGNDTLVAGTGADIADGGTEIDTVVVLGARADYTVTRPNATDTVLVNAGKGENLTLRGIEYVQFTDGLQSIADVQANIVSVGDDSITGTSSNDSINGMAGNDTLLGLEGNDTLIGGAGNDSLVGGLGDDLYEVDAATDSVVEAADEGYDTVNVNFAAIGTYSLGANVEKAVVTAAPTIAVNVVGNDGDNLIVGNAAANSLAGGLGKDTLDGGAGADTLAGGAGDDVYIVDSATDVIVEGAAAGIDSVQVALAAAGVYALSANIENATVTAAPSLAVGMTGNDLSNLLSGNAGNNALSGGVGNDTLDGGAGNDTLVGGVGGDSLLGGLGNDSLGGDDGDDVLNAGTGIDTVDGGAGTADTLVLLGNRADYAITRGSLTSTQLVNAKTGENVTYTNIEQVQFLDQTVSHAQLVAKIATPFDDKLLGEDGVADTLNGAAGNDTLDGQGGDDYLLGGAGNDILIGGAGNDILDGGDGNDTYRFAMGQGDDIIDQNDTVAASIDTLEFIDNIAPGDVTISRGYHTYDDLVIRITKNGDVDQVIVSDFFKFDAINNAGAIDQIRFTLGDTNATNDVLWSRAQIASKALIGDDDDNTLLGYVSLNDSMSGGAGNDWMMGSSGNDTLDGGDDNDALYGGAGSDSLLGGAGNDYLAGGDGSDIFIGGAGNDSLTGGGGSDTYRFALGDGQDVISEEFFSDIDGRVLDSGDGPAYYIANGDVPRSTDVDILSFAAGIGQGDLQLTRAANDLVVKVGTGGDSVTIRNFFSSTISTIDRFQFADGTTWTATTIRAKAVQPTTGDDTLIGYIGADKISGIGGNDVIDGREGNDTLDGGEGNDSLIGGLGSDSLIGGSGDDTLDGGDGNNILNGGLGVDLLRGGTGSDTYVWANGGGWDRIVDAGGTGDRLQLTASGATLSYNKLNGSDLLIKVGSADEGLVVVNQFRGSGIETLTLNGGTVNLGTIALGTDLWRGTSGDDTLSGAATAESMDGGAGNDLISGNDGNDTLLGGVGNDTLNGGSGNDEYRFAAGDGADTVIETGGNDLFRFAGQVSDYRFSLTSGNALRIESLADSNDSVTVLNFGTDLAAGTGPNLVEKFVFSNGELTLEDIKTLLNTGTSGNDSLNGTSGADTLDGLAGNDSIRGFDGNDSLVGGAGDDTLIGGLGNDSLSGGDGTNVLSGGDGNDVYFLGADSTGITTISGETGGTDTLQLEAGLTITAQQWVGSTLKLALSNGGTILVEDASALESILIGSSAPASFGDLLPMDIVKGTSGNDNLASSLASVTAGQLLGLAGDDTLTGGSLGDELVGGTGNDVLMGGKGSDTYQFDAGWGRDIIIDYASSAAATGGGALDAIEFGDSITGPTRLDRDPYTAIQLTRSGNTLYISRSGSTDIIQVDGQFGAGAIEEIRFANGTVWKISDINAMVLQPTSGNDVITGFATNDWISGGDGNDSINGGVGNDTLYGDAGNDSLMGSTGNDTLYDGAGSDVLYGDAGSDVYHLGLDGASDRIVNNDASITSVDKLVFDGAVYANQLWFQHVGDDLVVTVLDTGDSVTISNWYGDFANQVDVFEDGDGHLLYASSVESLVSAMSAYTPAAEQTTVTLVGGNGLYTTVGSAWGLSVPA